jgi:hypothetical protein
MGAEVTKKLFTVDEYYSMGKAGIIGPGVSPIAYPEIPFLIDDLFGGPIVE